MGLFGKRKSKPDKQGYFSLKVSAKNTLTPDSVELELELPKGVEHEFLYTAGQYINLQTHVAGKKVIRSYSICQGEGAPTLRVGIKRLKDGVFSNFALDSLQIGDELKVSRPEGGFKLDNDGDVARLFVASGSGITPVLSMLQTLDKRGQLGSTTLMYGNRTSDSTMFADQISSLESKGLNVIRFFTQQEPAEGEQKGRIDANACLAAGAADMKHVYLCGPQAMVDETIEALKSKGMDDSQIHRELFIATANVPSDEETHAAFIGESTVKVQIHGDEFEFTMDSAKETVLDAAERAGYDLPYSCRGAVCCTCRAKVTQGAANMDLNYALTDGEVEEGYILCCQARPTSDHIEVNFDE